MTFFNIVKLSCWYEENQVDSMPVNPDSYSLLLQDRAVLDQIAPDRPSGIYFHNQTFPPRLLLSLSLPLSFLWHLRFIFPSHSLPTITSVSDPILHLEVHPLLFEHVGLNYSLSVYLCLAVSLRSTTNVWPSCSSHIILWAAVTAHVCLTWCIGSI